MHNIEFFGTFDITALVLLLFTGFFFALIVYLRREDRREGYPIEDDITGRAEPAQGWFFVAQPKTFRIAGGGTVIKPDGSGDNHELNASRRSRVSGTPLSPVGDPMLSGVGPGAFARRATVPDLTDHGDLKITPLRNAPDFHIDGRDADPRGRTVLGVDGAVAGVVTDVWLDRGEFLIRYLEVEVSAGRRVLLPQTMAVVRKGKPVRTDAVTAAQFAGAPALSNPDAVTRDEEERICAYFGGGYLYATAARSEPLI